MAETLTLAPTNDPRVFVAPDGRRLSPPAGWSCLPPGDAGLTRRVKAAGPSWAVIESSSELTVSPCVRLSSSLAISRGSCSCAASRFADAMSKTSIWSL